MVSAALTAVTTLAFLLCFPSCRHWFVAPIWIAGLIIGSDAVHWAARKVDLYDPKGIVGMFGVHFFFLAPLILASAEFPAPRSWSISYEAWPVALGTMASLNALGVITYKLAQRFVFSVTRPARNAWVVDVGRATTVLAIILACCIVAKLGYYMQVGGISGLISAVTTGGRQVLAGTGWLLLLGNPLPVLLTVMIAIRYSRILNERSGTTRGTTILLIIMAVLTFLLVGLTGSRSATVWLVFQIVGIIHYFIRPVSRKLMISGLVVGLSFMYAYGFYKNVGAGVSAVLEGTKGLAYLEKETGRSFVGMLVGDLSRADLDAYLLHRLITKPEDYDLRYGITYLDGPSLLLPQSWRPFFSYGRIGAATIAGTELAFGRGSFSPRRRASSRAYGLAAEAMLNFSYFGIVPMFAVWGGLMGWYRKKLKSWSAGDARFFVAPFGVQLLIGLLVAQSHSIGFTILVNGSLLMLCVCLICQRTRMVPASAHPVVWH